MLKKLVLWYLRKKKCTVIINVSCGKNVVKLLSGECYIYDSQFEFIKFYDKKDREITDYTDNNNTVIIHQK